MEISPKIKSEIDVNLCRTCDEKDGSFLLKQERCLEGTVESVSLHEMLQEVAKINLDANQTLAYRICDLCVEKLESAYLFVVKARKVNEKYKNDFLESQIEEEAKPSCLASLDCLREEEVDPVLTFAGGCSLFVEESAIKDSLCPDTKTLFPNPDVDARDCTDSSDSMGWKDADWETQSWDGKLQPPLTKKPKTPALSKPIQKGCYKCNICGKTYSYLTGLRRHKNLHAKKVLECKYCFRSFLRRDGLNSHLKVHRKTCDDTKLVKITRSSEKRTRSKKELSHHGDTPTAISDIHLFPIEENNDSSKDEASSNTKPVDAEDCIDSNSKSVDRDDKEMETQSGEGKLQTPELYNFQLKGCYKCDICGKKYSWLTGLRRHENAHAQRVFNCELCSRSFLHKKGLNCHLRIHRKMDDDTALVQITQTFEEQARSKHQKLKGCYQCDICGKTYSWPEGLSRHKNSHTQKKVHQCEYCSRSFFRKDKLNNHLKVRRKRGECSKSVVNLSKKIFM